MMLAEGGDEIRIVFGARAAFRGKDGGGEIEIAGGLDAGRIGNVGDDDGDLDIGEPAFANGARDGEEVGAAAGKEDS
jgi:hypothetical protein